MIIRDGGFSDISQLDFTVLKDVGQLQRNNTSLQGPLLLTWINFIPAWRIIHMHNEVWD